MDEKWECVERGVEEGWVRAINRGRASFLHVSLDVYL